MITFIVSVYDRPWFLNGCLASLAVNPDPKQIIVCDNSPEGSEMVAHIDKICQQYNGVEHFLTGAHHLPTTGPNWTEGCKECYQSANAVAIRGYAMRPSGAVGHTNIAGDWLCFPSDDSLYVCGFTEIMLAQARVSQADLVYCDCVYRWAQATSSWKSYTVLDTQPRMGRIDKTCFIVRRELFKGFPEHPHGWRDGALIEQLIQDGVKHAKAPGVLVLHQ